MEKHATNGTLFILGGYDLEMITIKDLLLENGFVETASPEALSSSKYVADKKLSWGARLSAYREFLNYTGLIYGIELAEDVTTPENYYRIDHHNELSSQPSSLEQVAGILAIPLSRYQQLVAANDKGYIPAMIAMNASESEIETIRKMDRQAQGVTDKDERLAEESISNNSSGNKDLTIIKSATDKFSPVTDRMYGKAKRLLIYTDTKLVYYGKDIPKLSECFHSDIKAGKVYSGGGENGYFGLAEGAFTKEEIKELLNGIKNIVADE